MKFTLTFQGELPSSGNSSKKTKEKWEIRKQFHPQLAELFSTHPALEESQRGVWLPGNPHVPFGITQVHHSLVPPDQGRPSNHHELMNLFAPIDVSGRQFMPLVRESFALVCGLKILFLRKEAPGNLILQGGDIDNRIKTLFDALKVPAAHEMQDDPTAEYPMYCLLESDALITGVEVRTDRLLTSPNSPANEAHLIMEVDIRLARSMLYNMQFNGD